MASWMVATPKRPSLSTAALSARVMLRLTMPSWLCHVFLSFLCGMLTAAAPGLQLRIQAREHAADIAFVNLVAVIGAQDF
jgi:hypothetical protein